MHCAVSSDAIPLLFEIVPLLARPTKEVEYVSGKLLPIDKKIMAKANTSFERNIQKDYEAIKKSFENVFY